MKLLTKLWTRMFPTETQRLANRLGSSLFSKQLDLPQLPDPTWMMPRPDLVWKSNEPTLSTPTNRTIDRLIQDMLHRKTLTPEENQMPMKRLFTVFECDNGFIAEIGEAGKFGTVVGMSVSDVTAAAQTALATAKLRQDDEGEAEKQDGKDARVQKITHGQGQQAPKASDASGLAGASLPNAILDRLFRAEP